MEFIYGLFVAFVISGCLLFMYEVGKQHGAKLKPHVAPTLSDDQEAEREQQAEKAKQIRADFQRLLEYDVNKAQERKYEGG